jgi:hypothetical protein
LLHEHDDEGAEGGSPVPGDSEELGIAVAAADDALFDLQERVDIVEVTASRTSAALSRTFGQYTGKLACR